MRACIWKLAAQLRSVVRFYWQNNPRMKIYVENNTADNIKEQMLEWG